MAEVLYPTLGEALAAATADMEPGGVVVIHSKTCPVPADVEPDDDCPCGSTRYYLAADRSLIEVTTLREGSA